MARLFVQVLAIHNDANLAKSKNAKVGYNFLPKPSRKCQRRLNFLPKCRKLGKSGDAGCCCCDVVVVVIVVVAVVGAVVSVNLLDRIYHVEVAIT